MTTYLITGRRDPRRRADRRAGPRRGGRAGLDELDHRRGHRRGLDGSTTEVVDGTGMVLLPGLVDLHTHLREPGREDAETVETGTMAAAMGGFTAVHAMANTEPVADTAGVVEQVWRLGREAGHCDVLPGRRGHRRAAGRAARRARRDGRLRGPGAGVLRRRQVRLRPGADAPGAGVRQGVRRRGRPARPGAAAHRGRPDERGRALRPARAARLAGGRRGGDHRPRLPARGPRRLPAARLPRVHRRVGRADPLGQVEGLERHGRGLPAPPAADRRARGDVRPDLQGQPAAALGRRRRGAAGRAGRRHHRRRRHRPRAAPARGQGLRVAGRGVRDARAGDGAVDRAGDDGRHRPARLGRGRRADVLRAGPDRAADRPRPPGRRGRAGQPGALRPVRAARRRRPPSWRRSRATRRTPGRELPGRVVATFLRGKPTVLDGKLA